MADSRDILGKNRKFSGTTGIKLPTGTEAQRVDDTAQLRFNSDTNLAEYYNGAEWKPIDSPPVISGITVDDIGGTTVQSGGIDATAGGTSTIEILGSLFDTTGATVTFIGSGETINTASITRNSQSKLTVTVTRSEFDEGNEPYTIKVTNASGLSAELAEAIVQNQSPTFSTAADTNLGSIAAGASDFSGFTAFAASDPDGDTVTHTLSSGTLPTGVSILSNGTLTGTVDSGTTPGDFTFTVAASDGTVSVTRQYIFTVTAAPGDAEYTTPGSYTFTVPTAITNVSVVCIGAGGASGIGNSGQAGGGGALAYRNSISVTPGTTASITVGSANGRSGNNGQAGGSSSFTYGGTTTTAGGGGGGEGTGSLSGGSSGGGGTRSGTYDGGGNGGAGGQDGQNAGGPGGGGAGGYSGNGGGGASGYAPTSATAGSTGSGGGGGGGGKGGSNEGGGGGGGGVGFYGEGTSGAGGTGVNNSPGTPGGQGGRGGSSGTNGSDGTDAPVGFGGSGGAYGGGQGGPNINSGAGGDGANGAVRVVWNPASPATFPSTNVGDY